MFTLTRPRTSLPSQFVRRHASSAPYRHRHRGAAAAAWGDSSASGAGFSASARIQHLDVNRRQLHNNTTARIQPTTSLRPAPLLYQRALHTMAKPKALLLGQLDHAKKTWEELSSVADLVAPRARNRAEFIEECKSGGLDGVVAAYRTFGSVAVTGLIDEEIVEVLPESLRFICHNGAGYDQVDIQACTARGIRVSNVPTIVDNATADTNIFLILGALRGFNTSMVALREGKWRGNPAPPLGHDPEGKVLGILGMGGIGRNLKKKAEAFGMRVIYHNRNKLSEELAGGAEYVSFDELLSTSDVISLNLPLNKNTRHIISTPEFQKMKKGVVVVNTARGAVMDEDALVKALDDGLVWSAGLDVYEEEPKVHPGLIRNPHVMLVPHMGTWTVETQKDMEEFTIGNVRAAIEKGRLNVIVPEQADMQ